MARPKRSDQLTPLELEIMKVLWEIGPASTQAVREKLSTSGDRELAYTTVQTMLNVLLRKHKVKRRLADRTHLYRPTQTRLEAVRLALGDVVDRLFGGSPESLVLGLVETRHLRPEQLAKLHALVQAKKGAHGPR